MLKVPPLLFVCLLSFAFAQSAADSLRQVWQDRTQDDSIRFQALATLAGTADSPEKALARYQQLQDSASAKQATYWQALARYGMAGAYNGLGRFETSIETARQALLLCDTQQVRSQALTGNLLVRIGFSYNKLQQPQLAIESIKDGLSHLMRAPDSAGAAIALDELSVMYHNFSRWDSSIQTSRRSIEISQATGNQALVAKGLYSLGMGFYQLNQDDSARHYYLRHYEVAEAIGDVQAMANVKVDLGQILLFDGAYGQALEQFEQGLKVARQHELVKPTGWLLQSIGTIFFAQQELDKALGYFAQSMASQEAQGDIFLRMNLADVIGLSHKRKGEVDTALTYFQRGLDMAQQEKTPIFIAKFSNRMGLINQEREAYPAALRDFERSIEIYQAIKSVDGEANSWYRIGQVHQAQAAWRPAIRAFEQALEMAESLNNNPLMARVTFALQTCYRETGQYQQALETYEQHITLRDTLENRENQRALIRYEFEAKALSDSLAFVQEKAQSDLVYQQQLSLRNYLILASLGLGVIGLVFFRYRQQLRSRKREQELERERERQAQLAELYALKSRFFANISHELRTPLTLILGPLSYLMDHPEAWEKESVQQQLTLMHRNGKSLMQLIEEILDLSKLEANELALEEAPVAIVPLVEEICGAFAPSFQQREIDFSLDLQVEPGLQVQLDQRKFEKMLNNYLSNALKFTPAGGQVGVKVSETADRLQFQVRDTGRGIHPEDLPQVFERYYQARVSPQPSVGGVGIGLGLVKELATLMDGQVYAESELGKGSTFYLDLPKRPVALAPVLALPTEAAAEPIFVVGTDFTLLVVEDNPDMRTFLHDLLAPRYRRVLLAQNGREGLALLEKEAGQVDLILSDVMMPEMDGLTMLQHLKERAEWRSIPVVMLTALASERDKLGALTLGVDDYLIKPFSVAELEVRLQNLLYHAQLRREWLRSAEYEAEAEAEAPTLGEAEQAWLQGLETLIEAALPETTFTVEALAEAAHLSPRQLRRRLKSLTGLGPVRFIKEVQLQLARHALEQGKVKSLGDLAFRCGFEHQGTFSTQFKARFGRSPREYGKVG